MQNYQVFPAYPTFPTVEEWNYTTSFQPHLGAPVAAPPNQLHLKAPIYEARLPLSYSNTPPPHTLSVATPSPPSPSSPLTPYLGADLAELCIEPSVLPLAHRPGTPKKSKKKGVTTAEKRATIREKNRLSKRAQRERQVQKLALLEEKVVEQAGEIEELRRRLRKSEEVVSMLTRELQGEKRLGDGI